MVLTFVLGPFLEGRSAHSAGHHRPVGWQLLGTSPGQTNQDSHGLQPAEGLGGLERVLFGELVLFPAQKQPGPFPGQAGWLYMKPDTPVPSLQGSAPVHLLLGQRLPVAEAGPGGTSPWVGEEPEGGGGSATARTGQGRDVGWHS